LGAAHNFVVGLTLHPQPHQVCADLGFGGLTGHDLVHDGLGFAHVQMTKAPNHVNGALNIHLAVFHGVHIVSSSPSPITL